MRFKLYEPHAQRRLSSGRPVVYIHEPQPVLVQVKTLRKARVASTIGLKSAAEPKLGTNPLTYAFPTSSSSVVFDTATAAMAFFGVIEAKLKGEALPDGIAYDADGNPTTDPSEALNGSVGTFAKHKGFGLSLLVQLLGGPFADAAYIGQHKEKGAGTFVMAIDPGLLVGKDEFLNGADELTQQIKAAKPLAGQKVLLPGEHGDELVHQVEKRGEIEIADAIWKELCDFVDGTIDPSNPED